MLSFLKSILLVLGIVLNRDILNDKTSRKICLKFEIRHSVNLYTVYM